MKYKLIYVEWVDSMRSNGSWKYLKDIDTEDIEKHSNHCSVGFLVKETKDFIFLSSDKQMYEFDDGDISITDPFNIPKSAIRKRKTLKI